MSAPLTSAGLLTVQANYLAGGLDSLGVQLRRPPVTRLFIGQHPEAVVKTVPYLYTLCAHAQRAAAQAALAAAAGVARRPVDDGELWIEFLHENFWRLLLDWPSALGIEPANAAFIAWRSERQGADRVAATQGLIAGALREMAEKCRFLLVDRTPVPVSGFPALAPERWLAYWQGCAAEAPQPQRPASIAAAYARRLAEVELAAAALAENRPYPVAAAGGEGWGVGQTMCARGVLTHAVHVEEDKVKNYRVWAPTDCHFAAADGLQILLAGQRFADGAAARHALEQAVLALDPCLPYVLELNNA